MAFWLVGFGLMFSIGNGFVGDSGFMLAEDAREGRAARRHDERLDQLRLRCRWTAVPLEAKFFFQLVFAATAATIVSGAMAERTKFVSYMVYSIIISLVIYPISGHWIWGGGWLAQQGFFDFAGSTVVHSVGGWLSLVGAFVLGPRIGKFDARGKAQGHSRPQPGAGHAGRVHPVAGLVRLQSGQHDGGRRRRTSPTSRARPTPPARPARSWPCSWPR